MTAITMLDRSQAPAADTAVKAIATASRAAGTPAPGAWAFYLGGPDHNGGRGSTWTNPLLDELQRHGIRVLPIFVGTQGGLSRARGVSDANDAMALWKAFGSRGKVIAADIERHTSDRDPAAAVQYAGGWTATLHASGLRSVVYGSQPLAVDLAAHAQPKPDCVWVARYQTHAADPSRNPHHIPGVPEQAFAGAGQRAWQYAAAFPDKDQKGDTPCEVEGINVDISVVDAELFGAVPPIPKPIPKPAPAPVMPKPAPAPAGRTHVVESGDMLSVLEVRFGLKRGTLFAANRDLLDAVARKHGKPDSGQGHFIFPGTTLRIPG